MLGFIFALFYAAYLAVVKSLPAEAIYQSATGFLYGWYFWWTIILGFLVALFAVILSLIGGLIGVVKGRGVLGGILGTILGGGFSVLVLFAFAFRRALYLGGAYLLHAALVVGPQEGGYEWSIPKLVIGGLLLLVAFLTRSRSSSSSASSSAKKSSCFTSSPHPRGAR